MKHALAIAAETKASSLIILIKNQGKILKLLQFEKLFAHKSRFLNNTLYFC